MDNLNFLNSGTPLQQSDIDVVETELKIEFPREYELFMLVNNGGIPNRQFYSTPTNDYVINQFFSIENSEQSLQSYIRQFKVEKLILPLDLIPIADDAFGNLICIDQEGRVFFWSHEDQYVGELNASFNSFISELKDDV